jgi:hypothetical protein
VRAVPRSAALRSTAWSSGPVRPPTAPVHRPHPHGPAPRRNRRRPGHLPAPDGMHGQLRGGGSGHPHLSAIARHPAAADRRYPCLTKIPSRRQLFSGDLGKVAYGGSCM